MMKTLLSDLKEEYETLDRIVSDLDEQKWNVKTHCDGWTIKEVIAHIASADESAKSAVTDPDGFRKQAETRPEFSQNLNRLFNTIKPVSPQTMLSSWRKERNGLVDALAFVEPKTRIPWFGPSMSAKSFATARIMETWAHGRDVTDVLGVDHPSSDRLQHIAHLGVITFGWSFSIRNLPVPNEPVRVELTSPSNRLWSWGPEDAKDKIKGEAEDFCLMVTMRRHLEDTNLVVNGDTAKKWMDIAQCYAGPPDKRPDPGTYAIGPSFDRI